MLFSRLKEKLTEQVRPSLSGEGEEESTVDITMDTSEMDATIIEQGKLLEPAQMVEGRIYERLVRFEMNDIQWKFEALTYLISILQVNKWACDSGSKMRTPGEAYPKLWTYLGLKNLLTPYEKDTGMDDQHTSAEAQFEAAKRMHETWLVQQGRVRRPSQSPSHSRSQVDQSKPLMARIRYDRPMANVVIQITT